MHAHDKYTDEKFLKTNQHIITKSSWKADMKHDFQSYIQNKQSSIHNIDNKLLHFNEVKPTKKEVHELVNDIGNILINSASSCGLIKEYKLSYKNRVRKRDEKIWFNAECKIARENYLKAKFNYRCDKNSVNKENLKQMSKMYKKILNKSYNKYIREKQNKMRHLNQGDSRSFWKIINKVDDLHSKTNKDNCSMEEFVNHFEKLSFKDEYEIHESGKSFECNVTNDYINKDFKKKKSKNNKCPGDDNIFNEYIKHAMPYLLNYLI